MCGREASPKASPAQPSRVNGEHEDIRAGFHIVRAARGIFNNLRAQASPKRCPLRQGEVPRMGR